MFGYVQNFPKKKAFIPPLKRDLGIIRDKTNPYKWSHAYTKENIKFESWSNSIDLTKPAACMGDNGNWNLDNHCIPFCVEPLQQVLSLVFTWIEVP